MTEDKPQDKPEDSKPPEKDVPKKPEPPKGPTGPVPKTPSRPTGASGPVPKTPSTPPKPGGASGPVPKTPSTPPAKPVPKTPATPTRAAAATAAAARPGAPASPGRRSFMVSALGLAWTGFALATAAALSTVGRFLFPNVLFEPKMSFKAGKPDDYEIGKVDTRFTDQYGVWIVRTFEGMYVLSTICTHLGCPPSWLETEQKFKCPCHGSGFYKTGINFEGPAPRPLERFRIGLADDGQVVIDKSKKFQQEKGEWSNPEAFLVV